MQEQFLILKRVDGSKEMWPTRVGIKTESTKLFAEDHHSHAPTVALKCRRTRRCVCQSNARAMSVIVASAMPNSGLSPYTMSRRNDS